MTRARSLRAGAIAIAAVCALTLVGACGSSDSDQAGVAKEDRAVVQQNKYEAKIKAALRVKWRKRAQARQAQAQAQAQARARARAARNQRPPVMVRTPAGRLVPSGGGICSPIRPRSGGQAGRAERRARLQRRKQALNYLNLRCPSLSTPRL